MTVTFYIHFYLDKWGQTQCTGWVHQDFIDWLYSNDRNESEMGDDRKTELIATNIRRFGKDSDGWGELVPF